MWAFAVAECNMDHDKFWDLSWFEWSLYARRFKLEVQKIEKAEENHWIRFRIQWADFRNAHSSKKSDQVKPKDLITLPIDKIVKVQEKKTPDIEAVKKRFGAKLKTENGK